MDKVKFVENVKKYCAIKGVKPTVALKESRAGRSLLTNLEQNGSLPSVEKVQLLAQYLGVTTSQLLGEDIPATKARDQPDSPARMELHEIVDEVSDKDVQKLLDMAKLIKGWDVPAQSTKKDDPAERGTVDVQTEMYLTAGVPIEAGTPVKAGRYKCVGCNTSDTIEEDGEKLRRCPQCGEIYWTMTV